MPIRIYLAGPEVFLTNPKQIGEAKKALCRKYCFEGVFPIDVDVDTKSITPREVGLAISTINEDLIKSCDVVVANITPFRGASADVGTAYEMGYAHALGKRVFAYSNTAAMFTQRTIEALNGNVKRGNDGRLRDVLGMFIEEVELVDNLMLDGCVVASGGRLVVGEAPTNELFTYLGVFEKCLQAIKPKK